MWEWSRTVAERAAAASFTSWGATESRPTITDPDYRSDNRPLADERGERLARAEDFALAS